MATPLPPFFFFSWEAEDAVVEEIIIWLEIYCAPNINLVVCFFLPVLSQCVGDINPVLWMLASLRPILV